MDNYNQRPVSATEYDMISRHHLDFMAKMKVGGGAAAAYSEFHPMNTPMRTEAFPSY